MLIFGPQADQRFPLPVRAHHPGQTEHPQADLKAPVTSSLDVQVTEQNWHRHDAYLYGFALYQSGYYWEAHEIWEPVWMKCAPNSVERLLLQACIQLTNAALKQAMGKTKASARLYEISCDLLQEVLSRRGTAGSGRMLLGVDVRGLANQLK